MSPTSLSRVFLCSRQRPVPLKRGLPTWRHGTAGPRHGGAAGALPHRDWFLDFTPLEGKRERRKHLHSQFSSQKFKMQSWK